MIRQSAVERALDYPQRKDSTNTVRSCQLSSPTATCFRLGYNYHSLPLRLRLGFCSRLFWSRLASKWLESRIQRYSPPAPILPFSPGTRDFDTIFFVLGNIHPTRLLLLFVCWLPLLRWSQLEKVERRKKEKGVRYP